MWAGHESTEQTTPGAVEVGGGVGLFTVNFELGDKTLETLRQIANTVLCLGISRQKGPRPL